MIGNILVTPRCIIFYTVWHVKSVSRDNIEVFSNIVLFSDFYKFYSVKNSSLGRNKL